MTAGEKTKAEPQDLLKPDDVRFLGVRPDLRKKS